MSAVVFDIEKAYGIEVSTKKTLDYQFLNERLHTERDKGRGTGSSPGKYILSHLA